MVELGQDIINEATDLAEELLDAAGVPKEKRSDATRKIGDRIEKLAVSILAQAAKRPENVHLVGNESPPPAPGCTLNAAPAGIGALRSAGH